MRRPWRRSWRPPASTPPWRAPPGVPAPRRSGTGCPRARAAGHPGVLPGPARRVHRRRRRRDLRPRADHCQPPALARCACAVQPHAGLCEPFPDATSPCTPGAPWCSGGHVPRPPTRCRENFLYVFSRRPDGPPRPANRPSALAFAPAGAPATAAPTPVGWRENAKISQGRHERHVSQCRLICSRSVIIRVGQNPSRPSVTAGQPHP